MVHPASGFYIRDGKEYVSQSTVIGETDEYCDEGKLKGLQIWRELNEDWEDIIADSSERGTILHYKLEKSLGFEVEEIEFPDEDRMKHLKIAEYSANLKPLVMSLKKAKKQDPHFGVEQEKFSETFGFACTTDMNLRVNFGKQGWESPIKDFAADAPYTVWDWKNVRDKQKDGKFKAKSRSEHSGNFVQLGANALAHNEMVKSGELNAPLITQGVICALYSWRAPRFHVLNLEQLTEQVLLFTERLNVFYSLHGQFPRPIQAQQK
jgi:hypothetical protein